MMMVDKLSIFSFQETQVKHSLEYEDVKLRASMNFEIICGSKLKLEIETKGKLQVHCFSTCSYGRDHLVNGL